MSRNKAVLLGIIAIIVYFAIPDTPAGINAKAIMIRLLSYFMIFIIVYLVITLNMLKKAMMKLAADVTDEHVTMVVKRLRMTFDVKRMFGAETFKSLYNQVNRSKKVSTKSKQDMYEALKRKRIDVPLPTKGK